MLSINFTTPLFIYFPFGLFYLFIFSRATFSFFFFLPLRTSARNVRLLNLDHRILLWALIASRTPFFLLVGVALIF